MRILFVHQSMQSYVAKDLAILCSKHEVRECQFTGVQSTDPLRLASNIYNLSRGVIWADLTFCWFGKLHAFFAALFSRLAGKESVVVAGGDDVADCIVGHGRWGSCASPSKRWFVGRALAWTDVVLAVSISNLNETVDNASVAPDKVRLLYHGFDPEKLKRDRTINSEHAIVTVSNITRENYARKGLGLFLEAASLLPNSRFYVVGGEFGPRGNEALRRLKALAPPNVVFTGHLGLDDLPALLSRCTVYVQASQHESFGCSVAEAMLCECVPVVHRTFALPEVVGDCGYYIDELSPERLALAITQALDDPEMGGRARRRIIDHFPLTKRRDALLEIIDRVAQA